MTEQLVSESLAKARVKKYFLLDEFVVLPALENATRREAEAMARLSVAQTALALEMWRAARGERYPGSLEALVPEYLPAIPTSPFNGKPVVYRPRGAGYEVVCTSAGSGTISFQRLNLAGP
jgi:hypothetical protein